MRTPWLAAGNNPRLSLEVARPTVSIRLDPELERPWERSGFRHPNLLQWVSEHRVQLLWAALTLIQAWIAQGKPQGNATLGSYESWVGVMGGILEVAGFPDFLGNMDRVYTGASGETTDWLEFLQLWWEEYQDLPVGVDLLIGLATRSRLLMGLWSGRSDHSGRTRLGLTLGKMRDRIIGDCRIEAADPDSHNKGQRYRLVDLRRVRNVAEGLAQENNFSERAIPMELGDAGEDSEDKNYWSGNAPQPSATPRDSMEEWWEEEL